MTKAQKAKSFPFFMFLVFGVLFQTHKLCAEEPLKIRVGIYPIKIESLVLKDGKFQADFYIWFSWKGPKKLPGFEIMNGAYQFVGAPELDELPDGSRYEAYRIKGVFNVDVELHNYPFDRHRLEVQIENQEMDRSELIYVPDSENMKSLQNLSKLMGWKTRSAGVFERTHVYTTNFGRKEDSPTSEYSQLAYQVVVERRFMSYIMKSSFPIFVIVLMSLLALWVHPEVIAVRASIGITTLLSIVAYHVTLGNTLPDVGYMVTSDYFFMMAYVCCALSLVETVVTNRIYVQKKLIADAVRVDKKVFFSLLMFFTIGYVFIIVMKLMSATR